MTHVDGRRAASSGRFARLRSYPLRRWADRIAAGTLNLRLPDGSHHRASGASAGPAAEIHIRSLRLTRRLAVRGSLGLAEAYVDGDWDTNDLSALLELGAANEDAFGTILGGSWAVRIAARLKHRSNANSRAGSRRNIAAHYDLGNAFYRLWLDETMTYSAALFKSDAASLAEAQQAKYDRIIDVLEIGADDTVLEIGCGWGGFAEHAARRTGCRVTALTLSSEQARFARERIEAACLGDLVEIRLEDYRDCGGSFDRIVSIEMFEAVGEENWPVYFDTVHRRLKPGGRALVQSITIADATFAAYRRGADFIQTYIFPGGMLPSPAAFVAGAAGSGLGLAGAFFFGRDYERTLRLWDAAFCGSWHRIEALGFDERFKRLWRYYLNYCAAGFRSGRIDVGQFLLTRE